MTSSHLSRGIRRWARSSVHRPALRRWIAVAAAVASVLLGSTFSAPAGADPVSSASGPAAAYAVYVGYVETAPTTPPPVAIDFPTPWAGDPAVIYEGCGSACSHLDGGAVEVVNPTSQTETVGPVVVHLGPTPACTFNLWPAQVPLPAGGELVLTETAIGGLRGCHHGEQAMDSSDIGPNGADWDGTCTQSGVIPTVTVTENGHTTTFTDSGQVLNTGGVDAEYCSGPSIANESEQWTPIGHQVCQGATVTPVATNAPGSPSRTVTLTATVADGCGAPLPGASVRLSVVAGPHVGTVLSVPANAVGQAAFTLSYARSGIDHVTVSVSNPAGAIAASPLTIGWRPSP